MTTSLPAVRFAKGHGTQNDFVLIPDADGALELTPAQVAALCDRRAGIGADGVLRVVRVAALPLGTLTGPAAGLEAGTGISAGDPEWFMDYRNGDGSVAEMCGNGLRVFAAYLDHLGWARLADGESLAVATRAGVKRVRRDGALLTADLGPWRLTGGQRALSTGHDAEVTVAGQPPRLPGLSIDVGNPHVVVALPGTAELLAADLSREPVVEPRPPHGTNVELVVPLHGSGAQAGHLRMRVYERGCGETRSCGTGVVAAVLAARAWGGPGAPDTWQVEVPGGTLGVTAPAGRLLDGASVELTGPAEIIAEGVIADRVLTLR